VNYNFILSSGFEISEMAHRGAHSIMKKSFHNELWVDLDLLFEHLNNDMSNILTHLLSHQNGVKLSITAALTLERVSDGFILNRQIIGPFIPVTHVSFISTKLIECRNYLKSSLALYEAEGSGYRVKKIRFVEVRTVTFSPRMRRGGLLGGCYIPTPEVFARKSLINIRTTKNNCFMLSVVASQYRDKVRLWRHPHLAFEEMNETQRKTLKRIYENPRTWEEIIVSWNPPVINFANFTGLVDVKEICKFEQQNPDFSIHVYEKLNNTLRPIRQAVAVMKNHIDLLLLESEEGRNGHYVLIPFLGKFYGKQGFRKTEVCRGCFTPHNEYSKRHKETCQALNQERRLSLPLKTHYSFEKFFMHMDVNFKLLFTFHYVTVPTNLYSTMELTFTNRVADPCVAEFTLVMIDPNWEIIDEHTHFGLDSMEEFFRSIENLSIKAVEKVNGTYVPLIQTREMHELKKRITSCPLCHRLFNDTDCKPAFNHQHYTGTVTLILVPSFLLSLMHLLSLCNLYQLSRKTLLYHMLPLQSACKKETPRSSI